MQISYPFCLYLWCNVISASAILNELVAGAGIEPGSSRICKFTKIFFLHRSKTQQRPGTKPFLSSREFSFWATLQGLGCNMFLIKDLNCSCNIFGLVKVLRSWVHIWKSIFRIALKWLLLWLFLLFPCFAIKLCERNLIWYSHKNIVTSLQNLPNVP